MTQDFNTSSGTTSEPSTASSNGSLNLSDLLKGNLKDEQRQAEVPEQDDGDLPGVRGKASGDGASGSDEVRQLAEKLLDAEEKRDQPETAADEAAAEGEAGSDEKTGDGWIDGKRTLKGLAQSLDLDPKDLYEMQIPLGDGTGRHVSVEALRAGFLGTDADAVSQQRLDLSTKGAAFEVQKTEHEQTVIRDRQELGHMMAMLSKHLPPDLVQRARADAQRRLAASAADILERFPGWRDHKVAAAWQAQANKVLGKYGFSGAEASAISDGRLLSLVDSHIKLLDWADKVRNPKSAPAKPSKAAAHKPRGGRPVDKRAKIIEAAKKPGASREEKLAGVMALIGDV